MELADVQDTTQEAMTKMANKYHPLQDSDPEDGIQATTSIKGNSYVEGWKRTMQDYVDRISSLLDPKLKRTTLLVWSLWFSVSAAYTHVLNTLKLHVKFTNMLLQDIQCVPSQIP